MRENKKQLPPPGLSTSLISKREKILSAAGYFCSDFISDFISDWFCFSLLLHECSSKGRERAGYVFLRTDLVLNCFYTNLVTIHKYFKFLMVEFQNRSGILSFIFTLKLIPASQMWLRFSYCITINCTAVNLKSHI